MHFAGIRKYVFLRSGNTELATDIAQETFLKIWEKRDIQPDKVKGLLYKIAGDLFVSHYRKTRRSFDFFKHYQTNSVVRSPQDEMEYNQLKSRYEVTLKKMTEKNRTVFLMSRVEDLKYTEIAEILGISVKAVEKRMNKALEFLKMNLKTDE
jgi:RNA polymerase sigma factor (sigma-70 family)